VAQSGLGAAIYRIPALTVTATGTVLVAYDARPSAADLPSHIRVVLRRSTDGGRSFGPELTVRADTAPLGFGDPSLLVDRETHRIFLFYSATVNQGFFGSHTGIGDGDPDIQQADYSYSDDDGRTWHHRRITAQIKQPEWGGLFAASGQGIQLRNGPHAGRLVQQYVVRYQGANWAASAYSDDHGVTWRMGRLVGPGADENKSVELADGRVLLDVRASPFRKRAWSRDGGETWSALEDDPALLDPGNNGAVIQWAPDVRTPGLRAQWLLLSNTRDSAERRNLVVSLSCDGGRTWPVRKLIEPGSAAYSTLARLQDGSFALLYERDNYRFITLALFEPDWVAGSQPCDAP
jgi:sialidase-1